MADFDNFIKSEISFFGEREEVLKIVSLLCSKDFISIPWEKTWDRLNQIFSQYQEMPTILSPYLEEIVNPMVSWLLEFVMKSYWNSVDQNEKLSTHSLKVSFYKLI